MRKETKEKIYDVRLVQKHIFEGTIKQKDYEKYLSDLPDSSENSEELILESPEENIEEEKETQNDNLSDEIEPSDEVEITL
jgi:hypothetical protein